jgi:hypothetical protein
LSTIINFPAWLPLGRIFLAAAPSTQSGATPATGGGGFVRHPRRELAHRAWQAATVAAVEQLVEH